MGWLGAVFLSVCVVATPAIARGQTRAPAQPPLTLAAAVAYANDHYPAVRAALAEVNASAATVDVAHADYWPRLDSLWQSNRGTANNVFGQVLPQAVIPALSGPVLPASSGESVWGSATGALFSWEPIDFGFRRATVAYAESTLSQAQATEVLTRLDLQTAVAGAFLDALSAERIVVVAQSDLDRRTVLRQRIQTLVDTQLRPGADASRADAERAAALTQLIRAEQGVAIARIALERLLGGVAVTAIDGGKLESLAPSDNVSARTGGIHPAIQVRHAAVVEARSAETVLAKTDFPKLSLLASASARGSGASATGPFNAGAGGLTLARANWAAGFQVVFPNLFDFASLHAKERKAAAETQAAMALDDETKLIVSSAQQSAASALQSARAIAANTPIQLAAAQLSETQARARYDAGLVDITEVAEAQGELAGAEAQDELARIDVWRALLATAAARGDLTPFITQVQGP